MNGVAQHKFRLGQTVKFTSAAIAAAEGDYEITRLLPPTDGEFSYRIKSKREAHERVAREGQLSASGL
ncbi:hypothetical protein [Chelatococcus reniformis]|uniref:Uncharacterized protein n=1 Tax=Chelatococcus reniformis TaxID=1494448 RepID=A0A916UWH8_9HYPH|nr:hypothetical protein [Chelatococcus reniformis]GGC88517.1 hypothetical protein GCM10010994_53070 [Chelatococcus reniformis]